MDIEIIPNDAELIEKLSRQYERSRILAALKECRSMDEVQALIQKYETLSQEPDN